MTQTYEHITSHNNHDDLLATQEFSVVHEYKTEHEHAAREAARLALLDSQREHTDNLDYPAQPLEGFSHLFEARFLFEKSSAPSAPEHGSQLASRLELSKTPEGALQLVRELAQDNPHRDYIYSNIVKYYMDNSDLEFAHTLTKNIDDLALRLHMLTEIEARSDKASDGLEETIISEVTDIVNSFTAKDLHDLDQQELIALSDAADTLHNSQLQTNTQKVYREKYQAVAA